ncbi:MAG: transposase [Pseudomonas sp.]|uniref:REP-associated tyrosine transposase n=2 Tax=Pseudomonadota TaxID=1224 RepID=UPI002723F53D|nr:transposase [Pseudomonas sp.]MDO9618508.1 transposase [Pseudomonas sp.]MDP2441582.1 transposase [Rhodoferax sp.]MDZ4333564.1 transposase [Pseudomonas sp.]
MVSYRRAKVAGACYFLTLGLQDRSSDLLVRHHVELGRAMRYMQQRKPCRVPAIVLLPDHVHMLMTLPEGDADYSSRIRLCKSSFVSALRMRADVCIKLNAKGEANVWQRRFWEHLIRDEQDFAAHVDYIHINPLKHGLVERVDDWIFSSFHRYVRAGLLPAHWAGGAEPAVIHAGE